MFFYTRDESTALLVVKFALLELRMGGSLELLKQPPLAGAPDALVESICSKS